MAAVDRKWFSGAVPGVSNDQNRLDHSQTVRIHQENTSDTPGTTLEDHFRFAAATLENDRNRLGQPQTVGIHPETTSVEQRTTREVDPPPMLNAVGTRKKPSPVGRSKLLPVATKPCRRIPLQDRKDNHFHRECQFENSVLFALGRTVSEIWGSENFPMHFRGGIFDPKIEPPAPHVIPGRKISWRVHCLPWPSTPPRRRSF